MKNRSRMTMCDQLAEALIDHHELDGALAEHTTTCAHCQRLRALPSLLSRAASAGAVDVGYGFAARVTASAQATIKRRHRRRVMLSSGGALAVAATLAWFIIGVSSQQRPGAMNAYLERQTILTTSIVNTAHQHQHRDNAPSHDASADELTDQQIAAALVELADPNLARKPSPQWRRLAAQHAAYEALLIQSSQGASK